MRAAAPAAVLALLLGACVAPRCRNAVTQRVAAPGGQYVAVIYHRSCGADQGASSEVAVLPRDADLPDVPTSVLTLGDSVPIAARWKSPGELALSYPADARVVVRVARSADGVAVVYADSSSPGHAP